MRGADSSRKGFIVLIRLLCLFVISFGVITNIAGMDLGALWDLSDFANILMVYCNLPLQYLGLKYVTRAWKHFEKQDGTPFTSEIAGTMCRSGGKSRKKHNGYFHQKGKVTRSEKQPPGAAEWEGIWITHCTENFKGHVGKAAG